MPYRPAIDGLRAVAVILVMLFHARIALFSGGYVGVDVFFVISGFLITTLLLREQATDGLKIVDFYERRIRRIFPALFCVVFATSAIAAIVLTPPELARLGSSVVATALFVANFHFWAERLNYFQGRPELEPLLHTWSLSIEEQFYLFFPIFLIVAARFLKRLEAAFLVLVLLSLALSIYLTSRHPQAAFFWSPSRAWELLLGGWLAVTRVTDLVPRQIIPTAQWFGLIMIAGAAIGYDARMPFPGAAALLPCVGTLLLIAWCDQGSKVIRALSHPIVVWLGLISYPLYLWHWSLLVLARHALLREPAAHEIAAIYLLSGVLAVITWHYVEKPIRARKRLVPAGRVFVFAAVAGCLAVAIGAGLSIQERMWTTSPPERVARLLAAAQDFALLQSKCHGWDRKNLDNFENCIIGARDHAEFDFALWGDSHAGAFAVAVHDAANRVGKKGLQLTDDNCPPVLRFQGLEAAQGCQALNEAAWNLIRRHGVRRVILSGQWFQYVKEDNVLELRTLALRLGLEETIRRLRAAHIDTVIVGPVPYIGWNVPSVLAVRESRGAPLPTGPSFEDFRKNERHIIPMLKELERDDVHIMYPHEQLCGSTCMVQLNGDVLYSDAEHLSKKGADLLRPKFVEQLSRPSPR